MMWKRKTVTEIEPAQYALWLRAQRPPFDWFMRQPPMIQQALANEGDAYVQDCIQIGTEIGEKHETEEQAAVRLANQFAEKLSGAGNGPTMRPPEPVPVTMAGLGERRRAKEAERDAAGSAGRSLFGREPDDNRAEVGPLPDPNGPERTRTDQEDE